MLFYKFIEGVKEEYGYVLVQFLQLGEFSKYNIVFGYLSYWIEILKLPGDEFVRVVSFDNEEKQLKKEETDKLLNEMWDRRIPHFNKSMRELGYKYEFVAEINSDEVDRIIENNKKTPLNEQMLLQGMSTQEIKTIMLDNLNIIPTTNNELVIVDPYIFPLSRDADYENLFLDIINGCQASKVTIYTDGRKVDRALFQRLRARLSIPVIVYDATSTMQLHDRYWMVTSLRKGITCCSLNGMGKSLSTINRIKKTDIDIINSVLTGVSTEIR